MGRLTGIARHDRLKGPMETVGAVSVTCAAGVDGDYRGTLAAQKPGIALYVGGMGAREVNFHNEHMRRMGYADAAERIQELFLAGRKDEAIAAVPDDYVDERCLVGPESRIRERYGAWAESGITSMSLGTRQPQALEILAACAREHPARGVDAVAAT